jgi:NAD(P)H-flavin reductase/dihydroorotate dehydrogenase
MPYNLLGKEVRGRFGFPSGEIATNSDTARWMLNNIPQLGFYTGKSTTIEPKEGNPEDIFLLLSNDSAVNAVGYTNPGLEATIESFHELKESVPDDIFLMPQIGESTEDRIAHCISEFEKKKVADGYELNVSCPHAKKGGILIGSDPKIVGSITAAARKATKKPLVVKLNAGVSLFELIAKSAVDSGADGISAINTLGGPNPELSNEFGGLSGPDIFPVTYDAVKRLKENVVIVMGGISGASEIRKLDKLNPNLFYAIGTSLAKLDSDQTKRYFRQLEVDFRQGTNIAKKMTRNKKIKQYSPFVVKDITDLSPTLRILRFYENLDAGPGQYVFLKLDNKHSKPFSVASDKDGLELVIRKIGETTSKAFDLKENSVVRIKGPFGKSFQLPSHSKTIVYVGAGCGIAPVHHAATHQSGNKVFILGAKTKGELFYLDRFKNIGEIYLSTDDGSKGHWGFVSELLEKYLKETNLKNPYFFNCGPEIAMKKADEIERRYTEPRRIFHLVERMTSCGEGICGKCSIPNGKRSCVDGPVFSAYEFTPGTYKRDKTGKKVKI